MQLSKDIENLLIKLADEYGETPQQLVKRLVKDEDERRHEQYMDRGPQRVDCGAPNCFEKGKPSKSGFYMGSSF